MSRVHSHAIDHSDYFNTSVLGSYPTRKSCPGNLSSQPTLSTTTSPASSSATLSPGKFEKLVKRIKKLAPTTTTTTTTTTMTGTGDKAVKRASQSPSHFQEQQNAGKSAGVTTKSGQRSTKADMDHLSGRLSSSEASSTVRLNGSFQRHHSYTYGDDDDQEDFRAGASAAGSSRAVAKLRSYASPQGEYHSPVSTTTTSSSSSSSSSSSTPSVPAALAFPCNTSLAFKAVFGELAIKCVYREVGFQGDISLVRVDESNLDYQRLAKQLESIHGFSKRGLELELVYKDKDGDKVRIRDTESLTYACADWRKQMRRRKGNCGSMSVVAKGRRRQPS